MIINNLEKRILGQNDGFGELALLYNCPRSASIKTREKCEMWAIDRRTFTKVVGDIMEASYDENRKFIERIQFFRKNLKFLRKFMQR